MDEGRDRMKIMEANRRTQVVIKATAVHFQETCCFNDLPKQDDSKVLGPNPALTSGRMTLDPTVRDVVIPGRMIRVEEGIIVVLSPV